VMIANDWVQIFVGILMCLKVFGAAANSFEVNAVLH